MPHTIECESTAATLDTSPPPCECLHDVGASGRSEPCGAPAEFRVVVVCAEPGCDDSAGVHLLCRECKAGWVRAAAEDPAAPQLRVHAL